MSNTNHRDSVVSAAREYFDKEPQRQFRPGKDYIPPSGKVLDQKDLVNLIEASLDMWLTTGRFGRQFERDFAFFMDQKHCILVNSGSSANLIAFATLTSPQLGAKQIKQGDEIITVAAGFPTTVNPIIQNGCIPVFLDVGLPDFGVLTEQLNSALSSKTKAVMLAHTLGNPYDVMTVKNFCVANNLWLIEDCCDAVGARFNDKKVGTYGDLATVSFYPAHHMTMGEGGAVLTSNPQLKKIAESFRDWGRDCWCDTGKDNTCKKRFDWSFGDLPDGYDHKYVYSHIGYNLKVTDMQAAIGCSQLEKLPLFIEKRNRNVKLLKEMIEYKIPNVRDFLFLPESIPGAVPSWFGFPITLKGIDRKKVISHLEKNGVGTRLLFGGNLIRQPLYKGVNYRVIGELKNTDTIMKQTFWVGIFPALDDTHMDYISDQLRKALL